MAKSYESIKAGWKNPNSDNIGKRKSYKDIKASDYDFGVDSNFITSFLKDSQEFETNARSNYEKVGYKDAKSAYESNLNTSSELRDRANTLRAYLNANKNNVDADAYTELTTYLEAYDKSSKSITDEYKRKHDYFSQWEDEESYTRDKNNIEYSQKYAKSTYADLQKAKETAEGTELDWLNAHDTDIQYVDTMSDEDLQNLKTTFNDRKTKLSQELAQLQAQKAEVEKRGSRTDPTSWEGYNEIVARIQEINEELKTESPVLYVDHANEAVTIDILQRVRGNEATLANLEKDLDSKGIYDTISSLNSDAEKLSDTIDLLTAYNSNGMTMDYLTDEQRKLIEEMGVKYGINTTNIEVALAEANKAYSSVNTEMKSQKKTLEANGYSWDDLEYHKEWVANKDKKIEQQKKDAEYAQKHPVLATANNILLAPMQIVDLADNLIDTAKYGYASVSDDTYVNRAETYNSTVSGMIDTKVYDAVYKQTGNEWLSETTAWLASGAYSGVSSAAQSALTTAGCTVLFGGAGAGVALAIMGTEAAASSYNTAISNGSTNGEAILTATASGLAEALFEKISLDKLLDIGKMYDVSSMSALLKSVMKNSGAVLAQGATEASEEFFTEIANKLADEIINGDHSAYNTAVANYKKMGYSDTDAREIASKDALNDVLTALYGGFIGGMGAGAGASVVQGSTATPTALFNQELDKAYYTLQGQNVVDNGQLSQLVTDTQNLGKVKGSKSLQRLANKVSGANIEATDTEGQVKYVQQVGKLYKGVQQAQLSKIAKATKTETEMNSFREIVKKELETAGVENVDKATDVIVKSALNNGKLTREESSIFNSVRGRTIIDKVLRSDDLQLEKDSEFEQVREEYKTTKEIARYDSTRALRTEKIRNLTGYDTTDGATKIEASDEEVEIKSIDSFTDTDARVKLDNGDTISVAELTVNNDVAVIINGLKMLHDEGMVDVPTANYIMEMASGVDMDAFDFMLATADAISLGSINYREILDTDINTRTLPENIRHELFKKGQEYSKQKAESKSKALEKAKEERKESGEGKVHKAGNVTFKNVKFKDLNKEQKAQIRVLEVVFGEIGLNVEFFASPIKNGVRVGENGSYNRATNTVRIDVFAGSSGEGLMLFTASHELTHFIREWSPEKFKEFADFLIERYAANNISVKDLINRKIKQSQKIAEIYPGRKVLTFDAAYEEVVADACESFLRDSNAKNTLVALAQRDKSLYEKVVSWIKDFTKLIKNALDAIKGKTPESKESAYVLDDLQADLQKLHELWEDALLDARANLQWVESSKAEKNTHTDKRSDRDYLYNSLVSKPNMKLTVVGNSVSGNRAEIISLAKRNAATIGKLDTKSGSVSVHVDDIGVDVILSTNGLKHGLRRIKNAENNANFIVTLKAGEIIKNSIKINEMLPTKNEAIGAYMLIGAAKNSNGDLYIVRSVINKFSNELSTMDVLYAINAKKELAVLNAPRLTKNSLSDTNSTISISDLLQIVNKYFPQILPEDVAKHFGYKERPEGDFSDDMLYQDREALQSSLRSLNDEYTQLKKDVEAIHQRPEYLKFLKDTSILEGDELDKVLNGYGEWSREVGLFAKTKRISEIENEQRNIEKKMRDDTALRREEFFKSIENMHEMEKMEYVDKAIERYGTTDRVSLASYLMLNGEMLDFSEGQGYRVEDHRAISEILDMPYDYEYSDGLIAFMNMGNIRMQTYGIDISQSPNYEQKSTLRDIISQVMQDNDEFTVDFSNTDGRTEGSVTYPRGTSSSKILSDIEDYFKTGVVPEYDSGISDFLYSDRVINESMTMEQAKTMIQKAFVLGGIYDWYDGEYKNGDDWIRAEGASEVALYIESDYSLMDKYFNDNQAYIDGDIYVDDVLEAYLAGTLVGKQAEKITRLDVSKGYEVTDNRFYAPKKFGDVKSLWEKANEKLTKANKAEVTEARKSFLFAAHNSDVAAELGISASEVNKKLRSWSNYSSKAKDISTRLNNGVAESNQWSGIQNCSILSQISVTDEDISSMVKEIKGTSSEYQRNYIAKTMLALNTHIDWSELIFDFKKGFVDENRRSVRGLYENSKRTITIGGSSYQNTVAHEMGHALDYKWQRDLFGEHAYNNALTDNHTRLDLIEGGEEAQQFYKNFRNFIKSLTDVNVNYSAYTMDAGETFARFVAKFVEWVNVTANSNTFRESDFYGDKFTGSQYIEFVKLLQEKSKLDAKIMSEDVKFQDRTYAPTFYSQMGKVIESVKQEKLGAASVIPMLKGKGIKNEEIKWSGIEAFLEGKKSVTKQELQGFIAGSMLQIEEVALEDVYGEIEFTDEEEAYYERYLEERKPLEEALAKWWQKAFGEEMPQEILLLDYKDAAIRISNIVGDKNPKAVYRAEYNNIIRQLEANGDKIRYLYQVAGDRITSINTEHSKYKLEGGSYYRELLFKMPNSEYTNEAMRSHWHGNGKGVLAHARVQDFIVDGKKMLFIEEIQSDWHNEGNKRGYAKKLSLSESKKVEELLKAQKTLFEQMQEKSQNGDTEGAMQLFEQERQAYLERKKIEGDTDGVPDAPFKDNYHEYVLKRLLRMAAEEDYDSIGWTSADIQSRRWSDEYAEGYRIEYDQNIPKFLNKYGKKWGAKVGKSQIDTGVVSEFDRDMAARGYIDIEPTYTEIWSMDITDSMKDSVLYEGQALYQDRPYKPSLEDLGIKRENESLKADIENLKEMLELQSKVTHGKVLAKGHYKRVAKDLLHKFGIERITDVELLDEVVEKLSEYYSGIINSEDLTWEFVNEGAYNVARWLEQRMPDIRKYKHEYASEFLKGLSKQRVTFTEAQKAEAAYSVGGTFEMYRKMHFGKFKIVNEGGGTLTGLWDDLVSEFGGIISDEYLKQGKVEENIPSIIVKVIEEMRETESVFNEEEAEQRIDWMASEIYNSYWEVPAVKTLADKHQLQVNLLKGKHKEQMDALRKTYKEKEIKTKEQYKEHYYDMIARIRADKDAKLKDYKERVQEQRKKNVEGRNKTALKNKLKNVIKQLDSLYNNGTKERNVKIDLRDTVEKALILADVLFDNGQISNFQILTGDITTRLSQDEQKLVNEWKTAHKQREEFLARIKAMEAKFGKDMDIKAHQALLNSISHANKKMSSIEKKLSGVFERQRGEIEDNSVKNAINALTTAYKSMEESKISYVQAAYSDYVYKRLDALRSEVQNTKVKNMTLMQLQEVYDAYKMVLTSIRTSNEVFLKNKRMSVEEMGTSVIAEVSKIGKSKEERNKVEHMVSDFSWKELKPIFAFERIGSKTFLELYNEARKGEDTFARDVDEAKQYINDKRTKYGYDSWDMDKKYEFKLIDGRTFSITLQELMSIYAYSKREQALDHISEGGFVFDNNKFFLDKKEKGLKGKIEKQRTTVKAYRLGVDELVKVVNSLTDNQKKYVDEMQDYLSAVMGAKGNEVSRVLYGIDLFKEKYYFPLVSSKDFIFAANNPAGEIALRNSGMTKATVPHARNPIVLDNFEDVWASHVNKMSLYHALVLPIENLNKVHNYTGYARNDESYSVSSVLSGVFGNPVNDYISTFIKDLNGGVVSQGAASPFSKLFTNFKKTAVAASTSVVVQQPTAILRAMALMNPKYFKVKSDMFKPGEAWEEIKKYAPVAILKEIGGFDVGGGKQIADYITENTNYDGIKAKAKAFFADSAYRDKTLMSPAGKADELGWGIIWSAVQQEIKDTTTYKVGSEEFYNACGERFTEVITYTQVYDSVFSRSAYMRSKNDITKMATAFMGEPTTSFNMMYNAVLQAKRGSMSKGKAIGVVSATLSSIILAAIAKSFIYALRDDDEDESYAEKYLASLIDSLASDLFIPNMLPFVKDITSLLQGWDVERTDMAIFKDIKDAVDGLDSSTKSTYRKVEDILGAFAALFGIPLGNVMRTGREFYNAIANIFDDNQFEPGDFEDAVLGDTTVADINEELEKGNTEKAKTMLNEVIADKVKSGKTEKEAKAAVKSSVTSYWKPLYLQAYKDNDNTEMLRIRRILQSLGIYDSVPDTCSDWIKSMKNEKEETETKFKKW